MMTDVRMTNVPGYCHVRIEGHAGYGVEHGLEGGHDIVCASISMLGYTAARCIMQMSEEGKLGIKELSIDDALIDIKAIPKTQSRDELDTVIRTVRTGFELIAEAYPGYINLGWEILSGISANIAL